MIRIFFLTISALLVLIVACNAQQDTYNFTFTWTAPGDDGNVGTCSGYDLRYHTEMITSANWDQCIKVSGIETKIPQVAGSDEEFNTNLTLNCSQTYYFAIKAFDEKPNYSDLSNVIQYTIPDCVSPGTIIIDFGPIIQQ